MYRQVRGCNGTEAPRAPRLRSNKSLDPADETPTSGRAITVRRDLGTVRRSQCDRAATVRPACGVVATGVRLPGLDA
jgi:hypothetical protein